MRVLLLADVHANWPALLAVQRAEPKPDAVLFAGDAVGYGPQPAECARWLVANTQAAVLGNHDAALAEAVLLPEAPVRLEGAPPELTEAAVASLEYSRRWFTPVDAARLLAWPKAARFSLGGASFYLCHGTPHNPLAGSLHAATAPEAELQALFEPVDADVIVLGHTHLPALRQLGRTVIVNPGSLGQPRYGVPDATYAVWQDGRLQIHHLHYDHGAVAQQLRLTPLGPEVVDTLTRLIDTGLVDD
jgi:putative phosphoesterase